MISLKFKTYFSTNYLGAIGIKLLKVLHHVADDLFSFALASLLEPIRFKTKRVPFGLD